MLLAHLPGSGAVGEGCYAAVFMDK